MDEETDELLQRISDAAYWGPGGPGLGARADGPEFTHPDATLRLGMIMGEVLAAGKLPTPAPKDAIAPRKLAGADRIALLALSFPTLQKAPGVSPWNARAFEAWAVGPVPSSGAFHAARFVLHVWNSTARWSCGPFDLFKALQTWDEHHRAAFAEWALRPWQP